MNERINHKCMECAMTKDFTGIRRPTHIHYEPKPDCWVGSACSRKRSYYRKLEYYRQKQRDNHRYIKYALDHCALCQTKDNIQVHHIIPQKNGGKDERNNLMTLCLNCHQVITRYNNAVYAIQSLP